MVYYTCLGHTVLMQLSFSRLESFALTAFIKKNPALCNTAVSKRLNLAICQLWYMRVNVDLVSESKYSRVS